jgi:chorismate mutase / prephenate dehydratase
MTDVSPSLDEQLKALRRELDGVDRTLLSLCAERLQLVERLNGLAQPPAGLPIQTGSEVTLLRRLLGAAPAGLERELVVELWRGLIAASLRRQRVIDVAVGGGRSDPTRLYDIARRHFGARARIQHVGDPQAALLRVVESPDRFVAVTPWPAAPGVGAWWPALSEQRFRDLHLIAGLPLVGPAAETPEACVFAVATPDEAGGGDSSLLMAFDPHHRVQRALKEVGFEGRELARAEPRVLLQIEGFVAVNDPRAAAMTRAGLDSVRVLGSYARV